jgi:hypothetical protein
MRCAIQLLISYKTLHRVRMSSVCLGKPTERGDVRDATRYVMGIGYQIVGCSPRRGCGKQDRTRESRPLARGIRWNNTMNVILVQKCYTRAVSCIQNSLRRKSEVVTADAGVNKERWATFVPISGAPSEKDISIAHWPAAAV